jgi:baculoviral IAP repeat-containing protein 5
MEVYEARLDSFSKSKRVKSSSSLSRSTTSTANATSVLKWPHPPSFPANPTTLAEAGFYYTPGVGDVDNVTCFMCYKRLSEWSEEDDPFELHWKKCKDVCPWAIVRCGLNEDLDGRGG